MKLSANDIVLKLLGLLLLTAAMLKGYQLITEPVANTDLWSNRISLIFTVEFELAMGIWLISGVFRRIFGKLMESKEWFMTTPAVVKLSGSKVIETWDRKPPNLNLIFKDSVDLSIDKSLNTLNIERE